MLSQLGCVSHDTKHFHLCLSTFSSAQVLGTTEEIILTQLTQVAVREQKQVVPESYILNAGRTVEMDATSHRIQPEV